MRSMLDLGPLRNIPQWDSPRSPLRSQLDGVLQCAHYGVRLRGGTSQPRDVGSRECMMITIGDSLHVACAKLTQLREERLGFTHRGDGDDTRAPNGVQRPRRLVVRVDEMARRE